jgi:GNAT superfamily N-acetyltransferase
VFFPQFKGRSLRTIVKYVVDKTSEMANVFEMYGVNECLISVGLCVDPMFRGQGLGLEILKTRFDLCKAVGLKAAVSIFTAEVSQLLAHRAGMEVIAEVWYDDCKEDGKPAFPNIKSVTLKVIAKLVE